MPAAQLELIQSYRPANFQERGIAVPFTAPALGGARARLGGREEGGFEIILPNPSGGRGLYIMPWAAARDTFRPSLHDHLLATALGAIPEFTPAALRRAATAVIAGGAAGRAARRAAEAAMAAERKETRQAHFHLLLALIRASEAPGAHPLPPEQEAPARLETRASAAIQNLAQHLGLTAEAIASGIEALAALLAPLGIGPSAADAFLPRQLAALVAFCAEVEKWGRSGGEDIALALLLSRHGAVAVAAARAALADAAALLADPLALFRAWFTRDAAVIAHLSRADWLLDGWAPIPVLWRGAARAGGRHAVLDEILRIVPHLPTDILAGLAREDELLPLAPRRRGAGVPFRAALGVGEHLARNEALRAAELRVLAA